MPKSKGAASPEVIAMRKAFSERLAAALANPKHPMTRSDLARKVGVSRSTVNSWLHEKAIPGGENLIVVSRLVQESVSFLLPSGFSSRDSVEKKGGELAARIGPRLLDRLLALPPQRLRRELHGIVGIVEDEADRLTH